MMKVILFKFSISTVFLLLFITSCERLDPKQRQLDKMCDCMDKNQGNFNSRAAGEMLGSYFNTTMAAATAYSCAKGIMERESLSYTEMMGLLQDFTDSECGKRFGINPSSIDKMEEDAIKVKDGIKNWDNDEKLDEGLRGMEDTIMEPQIDTLYTDDHFVDTLSRSGNGQPMSDDYAQKMFDEYVNPELERIGGKVVQKEVVSDYPFRPKEEKIEYMDQADKDQDSEGKYLE